MKKNYPVTGQEVVMDDRSTLVSTTDLKGQITYVNPAFLQISGFEEAELIGASHNIVRHPEMPPAAFQDLWTTVKSDKPWRGYVKNRCKNGDHYWVDAFVTPIFNNGQIDGFQSVRSKPSRKGIESAQAIYEKLNTGRLQKIPKKRGLASLSLKHKFIGAFSAMMLVFAVMMGFIFLDAADGLQLLKQISTNGMVSAEDSVILDELISDIKHVRNVTISMGLFLILMVVVLILMLIKMILAPMQRIKDMAMGIASGDLREEIEVKSSDELGEIFLAMKLMQARLQTVVERMMNTTGHVSSIAEQFSDSAEETARAMQSQQAETEQVATAMNEMSATVSDVARNTEEASLAAQQASDAARNGHELMHSVTNAIGLLAGEVDHSSESILNLEEKSQNISKIMEVIRGIAEQTNLLALNAAIEAARAGEQGRGFAVVADEVRSLAKRTQEATLEINDVIEELRQGIGSTVKIMGRGKEQAGNAVAEAENANRSLQAISDAVRVISDMNSQIATAATEQQAVAEEMNRNVVAINEMTNSTAEDAVHSADNGVGLVNHVGDLRQQFSMFHIK